MDDKSCACAARFFAVPFVKALLSSWRSCTRRQGAGKAGRSGSMRDCIQHKFPRMPGWFFISGCGVGLCIAGGRHRRKVSGSVPALRTVGPAGKSHEPALHAERGIRKFDRRLRGHTNRHRTSFRVPLQNQRAFLPIAHGSLLFLKWLRLYGQTGDSPVSLRCGGRFPHVGWAGHRRSGASPRSTGRRTEGWWRGVDVR